MKKPQLESITYSAQLNLIKLYYVYKDNVKIQEIKLASALSKKELLNNMKALELSLGYTPITPQLEKVLIDYLTKLKKLVKPIKTYKRYRVVICNSLNQSKYLSRPLKRNSTTLYKGFFGHMFASFKTAENSAKLATFWGYDKVQIQTIVKQKRNYNEAK